jgi:hypothetical protein
MSAPDRGIPAQMMEAINSLSVEIAALGSIDDDELESSQRAKIALMAEGAADYFLYIRHVALFGLPAPLRFVRSITDADAEQVRAARAGAGL